MPFTRRHFLAASAALPTALRTLAQPTSTPHWVILGTDKGRGIFRASWDPATGALGHPELAAATPRAAFFALHPHLPVLYAVNSVGSGKGALSSFRYDPTHAALTPLNTVSSHGDGPCAVSVDRTGSAAFVANYTGGSVAFDRLDPATGALIDTGAAAAFDCNRDPAACFPRGPVKDRQDAAHLHCVVLTPDNRAVLTCDLGSDAIYIFPLSPETHLPLPAAQRIHTRPGSGPRHIVFHPNGRWAYLINELDCTIDLYDWKFSSARPTLRFREGSTRSTLPDGIELEGNTACELVMADNGRFLYACTRGANDIAVYTIDRDGLLTEQQRVPSGGPTPRYIALDPSRRWLVCTNQGSDKHPAGNVTVFAHEPATGRLNPTPRTFPADTPMFVSWI